MKRIDFENGSVTGNILGATLPMLVAQILNLLYNIVDRVYIARIPKVGTTALGAVGLCFPIIVIITAFSNLFGTGGTPLFSIYRGKKQENTAVQIMDTSFSMLCICLVGYWYGLKTGLTAAVAYGILQFITGPYVVHPTQVLLDYPLAFGALGLAGFFNKKKWGLQIGYIVGVIGRFVFATISGVVFFAAYAPEGMSPLAYSAGYQASYLVPEAIITLIIICIPPVSHALAEVRKRAVEA